MKRRTFVGVQAAFLATASRVAARILAEPDIPELVYPGTTATAAIAEQQLARISEFAIASPYTGTVGLSRAESRFA